MVEVLVKLCLARSRPHGIAQCATALLVNSNS